MYQSHPLPYTANCEQFFSALRSLPGAIWFDSGRHASSFGRYDIITAAPSSSLQVSDCGDISLEGPEQIGIDLGQSPFALAQQLLERLPALPEELRRFPFVAGLAGYFSYEVGKQLEQTPLRQPQIATLPQMRLGLYHWSLVVDHQLQCAQLIFLDSCPSVTVAQVTSRLTGLASPSDANFALTDHFTPAIDTEQYHRAIERIHRYINAGDCYQVNFAQHFAAPFEGDPYAAYLKLRRALPSPFSGYMQWQSESGATQAVLSHSPERLLALDEAGNVESKPIKGTIRRDADPASDRSNADRLLNSSKDRAENLMIVDLLRNDLGKSCRPGSIRVPKLFALESYANVHHLVSTVTGQLADHKTSLQLLAGCFPGGSITGAPKRRAMEIIEELEDCQRSVYCGSIGYISRCGRMDTNIAIRTLVADDGVMHCWGGGGIVADSNPAAEYQESLDKVKVLMQALEGHRG